MASPNFNKERAGYPMANESQMAQDGGAFFSPATDDVSEYRMVEADDLNADGLQDYMMYSQRQDLFISPVIANQYKQSNLVYGGPLMWLFPAQLGMAFQTLFFLVSVAMMILITVVYAQEICDPRIRWENRYPVSAPGGHVTTPPGEYETIEIPFVLMLSSVMVVGLYLVALIAHWGELLRMRLHDQTPKDCPEEELLRSGNFFSATWNVLYLSYRNQVWSGETHYLVHNVSILTLPIYTFLLTFFVGSQDIWFAMAMLAVAMVSEIAGLAMNHMNRIDDRNRGSSHVRPIRWKALLARAAGFTTIVIFLTIWLCKYPGNREPNALIALFTVLIILWGVMILFQGAYYLLRDEDQIAWFNDLRRYYEPWRLGDQSTTSEGLFGMLGYWAYTLFIAWWFEPFYRRAAAVVSRFSTGVLHNNNAISAFAHNSELGDFWRGHLSPFGYDIVHMFFLGAIMIVWTVVATWPFCDDDHVPNWA